jgi:4'-phosphopantetheinyl transferase EntD
VEDLGGISLSGAAFGDLLLDADLAEGRLVALALGDTVDAAPAEDPGWHEAERAFAATLSPRRRRTWIGGRLAMRRAMGSTGGGAPLLSDDRGAPAVPEDVTGSIAHKDLVAVALAAPRSSARVGVDVELVAKLPSLRLVPRILDDDEAAELLQGDDAERARSLLFAFCAKEAIYKAIDPFVRRYVGFHEVRLAGSPSGYDVTSRVHDLDLRIAARARIVGDVLIAVATATPR